MTRRIIVLRSRPTVSFRDRIEGQALRAVSHAHFGRAKSPTLWAVVNEMALALSELRQLRNIHARSQLELRKFELELDREIHRRENDNYSTADRHHYHGDRLRTRQLNLKTERQRLYFAQAEDEREMHDKLLLLLSRQRQLSIFYDGGTARRDWR